MKNNISKINLAMCALLLVASCNHTQTPNNPNHNEASTGETHAHQVAVLSEEQLKLADIKVGLPEKRLLSERIKCTGVVEVPPQSLASVYSPVKG